MSSPPIDSQRLRLLVALAVLKCKPANQSCFAYIQDLRTCFPGNLSNKDSSERPWKERVFNLEKECGMLKEKLEHEQLQSLLPARNLGTGTQSSASSDSTKKTAASNPLTGKKKTNLKLKQDTISGQDLPGSSFDLKAFIKISDTEHLNKKGHPSARLFEAFESFCSVSTLHGQTDFPEKIFISITCRAIDSLSVSLDRTVKDSMDISRLHTLDTLLCVMIEKSFPIIMKSSLALETPLDSNPWTIILDRLSKAILTPLIRSFFVLSKRNMEYLLLDDRNCAKISCNNGRGTYNADGRPALLGLLHGAMTAMQSNLFLSAQPHLVTTNVSKKGARVRRDRCKASIAELSVLHHSLILQSIHHLNQILSEEIAEPSGSSKDRRVFRLVLKDTIWYLCSVLHIVINLDSKCHTACLPDANAYNKTTDGNNIDNDNDDGSFKLSANAPRLCTLKKAVLNCFLGLLIRQDRARGLESGIISVMPFTMDRAPIQREWQGNGDENSKLHDEDGLDEDQSRHHVGAASQISQIHFGLGLKMGCSVADADANSGSGRSMQAGEFGAPASSLAGNQAVGLSGVGGGSGTGIDIIHPSLRLKKTDRMHVVLDDREYGMLLGVVENYFNLP